jgi:YhfZ C-terminal domain/Helix-turn-helix domain
MNNPPALPRNTNGRKSIRDLQVSLAEYLIQIEPGSRLPSIAALAASTHMSVGAVSTALSELTTAGAVQIQKRGHQGSILESVSAGKLWNLIEQGPFVMALSLPNHSHFEGLATALKSSIEKLGIETYLIFIRGSNTRLRALKDNRCHAAVMSGLAADELCGKGHEVLIQLPPGTWVSGYSIFYRSPLPKKGGKIRVAIDPDSHDHQRLTELEFADYQTNYLHASFVQFPRLLKNGEVDAILWTSDQEDAYMASGIDCLNLSDKVMGVIGNRSISAAIIARADRPVVKAVIQSAVKPEEIICIQNKIVSGEMIPEY